MNEYLDQCREVVSSKVPLIFVLGNESCDLDSAVSALSLAYFLHRSINARDKYCNSSHEVSPLLNIRKTDLPLKTEIVYFFNHHQIDVNKLLCLDELENSVLESAHFVLVDHHVSPFRDRILFVVDHRPFDIQSNLPEDSSQLIIEVGSCTTLVFDLIRKHCENDGQSFDSYYDVFRLIYGTIILDTVNFSKNADKARPMDLSAAEKLESILQIKDVTSSRTILFNQLVTARADVRSLNSLQILSKDMKLLKNEKTGKIVAIPGYPILVQDYIKMTDAETNVGQFCESYNCDVIVLMGMKITDGKVRRDMGIINIKDEELFTEISNTIINNSELNLNLTQHSCDFMNGRFLEAANIKPSRKQILPLIKAVVDKFRNTI